MQVDVPDLPESWTLLEHVVVSKVLDDVGELRISHAATQGLTTWEAIGMLVTATDKLRQFLQDNQEEQ